MIPQFEDIKIKNIDDLEENIQRIERMIRNSKEYKHYLSYIYENMAIKTCDFFKTWDSEDIEKEFHHLIFLYNLVQIVGTDMIMNLENDDYLTVFDIVKQVILLHYENLVPGIILTKTIHQAYHAGLYQFDKNSKSVNLGNYPELIRRYAHLLTKNDIAMITYFLDDENRVALENYWTLLQQGG